MKPTHLVGAAVLAGAVSATATTALLNGEPSTETDGLIPVASLEPAGLFDRQTRA